LKSTMGITGTCHMSRPPAPPCLGGQTKIYRGRPGTGLRVSFAHIKAAVLAAGARRLEQERQAVAGGTYPLVEIATVYGSHVGRWTPGVLLRGARGHIEVGIALATAAVRDEIQLQAIG
jgi:hypothetical protein